MGGLIAHPLGVIMPLNKSNSTQALDENIAELISAGKQKGFMGKMRNKYGKTKQRQMAIAAAFAVKEKATKR